jgi:hypothetical protein
LKLWLITRKLISKGVWGERKKTANSLSRVSGKGNLKYIKDCFTLLVITASEKCDMTGREFR